MDQPTIVLEAIAEELGRASADAIGEVWVSEGELSALGGAVRLRAEVHDDPHAHQAMAHCHVIADLADKDEPLEACVVGVHKERRRALGDAGRVWAELVAGPVFSLMRARPVLGANHFNGSEVGGVAGCHGFVGPIGARMFSSSFDFDAFGPLRIFDYAAEMAPPRTMHIAKATLVAGNGGWSRNLEIDGHAAAHADTPWAPELPAPSQGIAARFAVFHFADQPEWVETRRRLDEAIEQFVAAFETTEDTETAAGRLEQEGVDVALVKDIATLAPLAFGRVLLAGAGVAFPPDFIRIRRDGSLEEGLHLMRQPVFARAMALCAAWMVGEWREVVQKIAFTGSELKAINYALNAGSKLEGLRPMPPLLPDPDASDAAIAVALERLQQRAQQAHPPSKPKPWWRFW